MANGASPFDTDKSQLLADVLDHFGVRYNRSRVGWQPIRCINDAAHSHGDANPSASANLQVGYLTCHACGIKGDGFSLMLELEGKKAKDVLEMFSLDAKKEESWLI